MKEQTELQPNLKSVEASITEDTKKEATSFDETILSDSEKEKINQWINDQSLGIRNNLKEVQNILKAENIIDGVKLYYYASRSVGTKLIEIFKLLDQEKKISIFKKVFIDSIENRSYYGIDEILKIDNSRDLIISDPLILQFIEDHLKSSCEYIKEKHHNEAKNLEYIIGLLPDIEEERKNFFKEKILEKKLQSGLTSGSKNIFDFYLDKPDLSDVQKINAVENVFKFEVETAKEIDDYLLNFLGKSIEKYPSLTSSSIIEQSMTEGFLKSLKSHIRYISNDTGKKPLEFIKKYAISIDTDAILRQAALYLLMNENEIDWLFKLDSNSHFQSLDNEIFEELRNNNKISSIIENLDKFQDLNEKKLLDLIEKSPTKEGYNTPEGFEGLSVSAWYVSKNLQQLNNLTRTIALKLIELGNGRSVARNLEKFKNIDSNEIALLLISDEQNLGSLVIQNLEKFKNLDRETGEEIINSIITNITNITNGNYGSFKDLVKVNGYYTPPLDILITKTELLFGQGATLDNYEYLKKINTGELAVDAKYFGVTLGGQTGINQLEQGFVKFRKEILKPDFEAHILQESELAKGYFKSQIRFDEAEWAGLEHTFEGMVDRYIEVMENGDFDIKPLNPAFTLSETLYIDTIDKNSEGIEYSESFLNRFELISKDIQKAKELYQEKEPLKKIIELVTDKLTRMKDLLQKDIEDPNPLNNKKEPLSAQQTEMRRKNLQTKLASLENLNLRSIKDFQENFKILAGYKELEPDLRQAMFVMGFAKNRGQLEKDLKKIDHEKPSLDDMTWMMNFVDHITNKETMSQYFTDSQAKNKFRELISVKSFEEELSRFQNQDKIGALPMKFIPTRGILMEFSGHLADACWADKYEDTIPATFPNFTAVTMVQNPDSKHERLCGSCMLIETKVSYPKGSRLTSNAPAEDTPLLVIRGLNPIQNTINELSVEDFYKKFTNYVKSIAQKSGKKVAIVIDGNSGGAATNRPILFNYLSNLNLEKIPVSYSETEFNGYDITNNTYLVN